MCWGPPEEAQAPIFIVLNAAPEAIAFRLPKMPEYRNWQQVLNTADSNQTVADFAPGSDANAPPAHGACLCGFGMNERQFGARLTSDGTSFRLWALAAKRVDLLLGNLSRCGAAKTAGFRADLAGVKAGARYKFRSTTRSTCPIRRPRFSPAMFRAPAR